MKLYLLPLATIISFVASESELQQIHVFFRHGSRTPELKHAYPTDPYNAETFWPYGYGGLTNEGKQMSYRLGQVLRQLYGESFGDLYYPELVEGVSTDYDRTKVTLLLVLAGLFPPTPAQTWNESILWNPIPIHFDKDKYDFTLRRPTGYCPAYVKELEEVMSSHEVQREIKGYRDIFKYIEKHTKLPMNKPLDVFGIYQTLTAEAMMNLSLPEWTNTVYPEPIQTIAAKQCNYENYNAVLKRLNGGRMLSKVLRDMTAQSQHSNSSRKIYLYSGHENNVLNILAALNLFEPHVPKYTSAVILELWHVHPSDVASHYVKVQYLKDPYSHPEEQTLEGCESTLCPLERVIQITAPHVPVNYTAECHSHVNLD